MCNCIAYPMDDTRELALIVSIHHCFDPDYRAPAECGCSIDRANIITINVLANSMTKHCGLPEGA